MYSNDAKKFFHFNISNLNASHFVIFFSYFLFLPPWMQFLKKKKSFEGWSDYCLVFEKVTISLHA